MRIANWHVQASFFSFIDACCGIDVFPQNIPSCKTCLLDLFDLKLKTLDVIGTTMKKLPKITRFSRIEL